MKTVTEKEKLCNGCHIQGQEVVDGTDNKADCDKDFQQTLNGAHPCRVVVRRLIPRNSNLDQALDQTCLMYGYGDGGSVNSYAVVYLPQIEQEAKVPWYHPPVQALAYFFEVPLQCPRADNKQTKLSLHYLPLDGTPQKISDRLHRTFVSLVNTFVRLSKHSPTSDSSSPSDTSTYESTAPSAIKDTIIPQHLVQNTYSRLKQTYASDLIARWVESTEPSKHVFEDLSITAFLVELWKLMYHKSPFPGFVDIACGNGVLVYILLKEGYTGWGLDARRRKTWDILGIDEHLEERICVPQPFLRAVNLTTEDALPGVKVHNGILPQDTFIISNHADELTPWTPLLASLSRPENPLPFLAIPCCSHALSGAKHRYTPRDVDSTSVAQGTKHPSSNSGQTFVNNPEPQPSTGDLKSLRTQKAKAATHSDDKSMYACLTKKVVALAEELEIDVELTLMRIPSTRNIGVVGGRKRVQVLDKATGPNGDGSDRSASMEGLSLEDHANGAEEGEDVAEKVQKVIERECAKSGGLETSARTWIERARKLQTGKGRGKLNLGHKPEDQKRLKAPEGNAAV